MYGHVREGKQVSVILFYNIPGYVLLFNVINKLLLKSRRNNGCNSGCFRLGI